MKWINAKRRLPEVDNVIIQYRPEGVDFCDWVLKRAKIEEIVFLCKPTSLFDVIWLDESHSSKSGVGMKEALEKIANWELPATGKFWDEEKTRPTSYETEYGSNGARDYIRSIARKALSTPPENECKWSDSDVKKFLEDYRVANMDIYLNPVIWFDKLNDEK